MVARRDRRCHVRAPGEPRRWGGRVRAHGADPRRRNTGIVVRCRALAGARPVRRRRAPRRTRSQPCKRRTAAVTSGSGSPGVVPLRGSLGPAGPRPIAAGRRTDSDASRPRGGTLRLASPTLLIGFIGLEIACQIALLSSAIAGARVVVRTAAFAASLALVFFLRGPRANHPGPRRRIGGDRDPRPLDRSSGHEHDRRHRHGIAESCDRWSHFSGFRKIRIEPHTLRKLFLLYWGFQTLSALVGALQVYFPGSFQPATAVNLGDGNLEALHITLTNGVRVLRPMGLTDSPGGAGIGAAYSLLLAAPFLLDRPKPWFRLLLLAGVAVSCFTIYLCQVRSMLLMVILGFVPLAFYAALRRPGRFLVTGVLIAGVALVAPSSPPCRSAAMR